MENRREFLKLSAAAAAAAALSQTPANALAPKATTAMAGSKPNIIMILADDMGFSDLGCYGSEVPTPNLDKLAAKGIKFSQFYNNPRCCPSRASIMTGLYPHQVGFGHMAGDKPKSKFPAYSGDLSANCVTVPEALKTAGYKTAMVGKWHLTPDDDATGKHNWPLQRGYDRFWGIVLGGSPYFQSHVLCEGNEHLPRVTDPKFYLTDAFGEKAVSYIGDLAKQKDPFFLYCAFNAPHYPLQAPEATIAKHAATYEVGWDALRAARHKKQLEMGLLKPEWPLSPRDPRVPAWPDAGYQHWESRRMAVYAAMIDHLDQAVGRIIDTVEAAGIADNTIILFMSDNGGNSEELGAAQRDEDAEKEGGNKPGIMPGPVTTFQSIGIPWGNVANTPFRMYKHYTQEGGISTPFLACWPGHIKPAATPNNSVGHETDLMPTFLELAGATYPKAVKAGPIPPLVGQSLVSIFEGGTRERGTIFWEHEGNRAVREGKWKLVSRNPQDWELYDMEADRTELHDLSAAQRDRVKAMSAQYDKWAAMVGVQPWPLGKPQAAPHPQPLRGPEYLKPEHNHEPG